MENWNKQRLRTKHDEVPKTEGKDKVMTWSLTSYVFMVELMKNPEPKFLFL